MDQLFILVILAGVILSIATFGLAAFCAYKLQTMESLSSDQKRRGWIVVGISFIAGIAFLMHVRAFMVVLPVIALVVLFKFYKSLKSL